MSEDKDQFLNKRKYSRINLLDPIRVNLSDYTFEEYIGNLSKTGCMVLSLEKKEIDENLSFSIKDPLKGYVKFNALIKRCIE